MSEYVQLSTRARGWFLASRAMRMTRRPRQPRRTAGSLCDSHRPANGSDDGPPRRPGRQGRRCRCTGRAIRPRARTLTDMPRAGWLAILKRSIREFKHDDITDRAAALTYYGVTSVRAVSTNLSA
jgi:hypothetical protein